MALTVGSRLGHYDVTALIGEGGMGQVYQATDTKLNRQVALKILPEAFATDPDRLARFQREAQVLASLNHPGIAAIYGIEEADDTRALVLELVEGPTLADRIAQGPISIDEALPIAKQIAEALEAAHEQGVIHRDLKPANIKVREDGTVKVLDFGLAKALDTTPEGDPSQSPTLTAAATQMGVIMGTAAYMSPEQARGKPVDKRADIWAFGAVLFEMLTGQRAFDGGDVSDTLAAVIRSEPTWGLLPADIPSRVATVLRLCLDKAPQQRVRAIGDVQLAMAGAFDTTAGGSAETPTIPRQASWRQAIPIALALSAVSGVIVGLVVWSLQSDQPMRPVLRSAIAVPAPERLMMASTSPDMAISPEGGRVAYITGTPGDLTGPTRLLLQSLSDLQPQTLADGNVYSPFFSPDGESLGFYDSAAAELQRVSVRGGTAAPICDLPGDLRGASWGTDDTIVFATEGTSSGLWRVPASGGVPQQLTTPDAAEGEVEHVWPQMLPGGQTVLFTVVANPEEDSRIVVLSLETGEEKVVVTGGFHARYASTGHLVYGARNALNAVRFDLEHLETVGPPFAVVDDVMTKRLGSANFGMSESGSLVYVPSATETTAERTMVWVDRQGREEPLNAPAAPYDSLRISPDGRYVAVGVQDLGLLSGDVMVYDLRRNTRSRVTVDPSGDLWPIWSPDGQRILFTSTRTGTTHIFAKAADGTGQAERLTTSETQVRWPESWSADGQTLVVMDFVANRGADLQVMSLGTENEPEGLIETEFNELHAEVSPDGRWIAYTSDESGQPEVYVRPFPNVEDGRWPLSRDGGHSPVWAPSGEELFFRQSTPPSMMVVAVETDPTFNPGDPEVLFAAPYRASVFRSRPWDVSREGDRFLMVKEDATLGETHAGPQMILVQNWFEELKRLVPSN